MQTQYGNLPIEIDPSTGRAKMVRGERGGNMRGPHKTASIQQSADKDASAADASRKSGSNPDPSSIDAYDSKLEAARATYWGYLLLAKDIRSVVHHPFTVQLSEKRAYTPDYLVEWLDGRLQVEEVKGSPKQKNARDSITRLHLAAAKLPMFDWRLTSRIRGQWQEQRIP